MILPGKVSHRVTGDESRRSKTRSRTPAVRRTTSRFPSVAPRAPRCEGLGTPTAGSAPCEARPTSLDDDH
jgi:hypothetical protein